MKSISVAVWVVLAGWWTVACPAAPIPTETVHTNSMRFRIPFQSDARELETLGAQEIRLYVSKDHGRHWEHLQSVPPVAGRFDFQAPSEGEYWFAVRTLDGRNRLYPSRRLDQPELKVVVDTTPPSIDLRLRQREPGRVELTWTADDEFLDVATLRLEYLQSDVDHWQPVNIIPDARGQTSWSLPSGGIVEVRGSVQDRASNVGRAEGQARIEPAQQRVPDPEFPPIREPIASRTASLTESFPDHLPMIQPTRTDFDDIEVGPRSAERSGAATTTKSSFEETATQNGPAVSRQNPFLSARPKNRTDEPSVSVPSPMISAQTGSASLRSDDAQSHVVPQRTVQPSAERPKADRTRYVNSTRFRIAYEVEVADPSGVNGVVLYITDDGGRKWYTYGDDPDRISPFDVEVPHEGTYGFSLGMLSGTGLAEDPPQPGDAPSIVVVVDETPPVAALLPLSQTSAGSKRIRLRWSVTDAHLHERPIALSYAAQPQGPWEPIGDWLPDTGQYDWDAGRETPPKLYIRLTARDAAGNTTHAQTTEPIVVDRSKPSARIVDVESAEKPTRR